MTRYSKTVTADGYEWSADPDGDYIAVDRGDYIEMIPRPVRHNPEIPDRPAGSGTD